MSFFFYHSLAGMPENYQISWPIVSARAELSADGSS
jgi:hypothetical protein